MLHQHNIHHRYFVNNDDICLKLRFGITRKAHLAVLPALCLEHAVHGCSRIARCLCKPFCCASRRCRKHDLKALCAENIDVAAHDGCLACSWSPCQNEDTVFQRGDDRLALSGSKVDIMLRLPRRDKHTCLIDMDMLRLSL